MCKISESLCVKIRYRYVRKYASRKMLSIDPDTEIVHHVTFKLNKNVHNKPYRDITFLNLENLGCPSFVRFSLRIACRILLLNSLRFVCCCCCSLTGYLKCVSCVYIEQKFHQNDGHKRNHRKILKTNGH